MIESIINFKYIIMRMTFTKPILAVALIAAGLQPAMGQCAASKDGTIGWSTPTFAKMIDVDMTALENTFIGTDGSQQADGSDTFSDDRLGEVYKTGTLLTPIYGIDGNPNGVKWPIQYYNAAFAPTQVTSALAKMATNPNSVSKYGDPCWDNSYVISGHTYKPEKPGFIEFCKRGALASAPGVSRQGYIVIPHIPHVEVLQWYFSSTSWLRGMKVDIKYGDGDWEPLRWMPTAFQKGPYTGFSEQGYQLEQVIGEDDISLRFKVWDGGDVTDPDTGEIAKIGLGPTPLTTSQVVRIHTIRIFSDVIPTEAPSVGIAQNTVSKISIYKSGKDVVLSSEADVDIYSIDGKIVSSSLNTKKVDLSNLSSGIYIVKAKVADGSVSNVKIAL